MARLLLFAGLVLSLWFTIAAAQTPPTGAHPAAATPVAQPTSRTFEMSLAIDRMDLQAAVELVAEKIGVPIELVADDMRINGITRCQSFGFNEPKQPLEQLLKKILAKADPDGRYVYTVKPNPQGVTTVYIAIRREAEKRGDVLFPEFALNLAGPPAAAKAETQWSSSVRAATLESEVPRLIEALGKTLESKASPKEVRTIFGQLAAILRIIEEYDGDVRWKSEARVIRNVLADALPKPALQWDEAQRQRATAIHSDLIKLLAGQKWPQAAGANVVMSWDETAGRPALMQRLEYANFERLAKWDGRQETLNTDRDTIVGEAEIIAAFAKVLQDSSYEFAEDRDYAGYAKALEQQSRTVVRVATKGDYFALRSELKRLQKCCDDCHGGFR